MGRRCVVRALIPACFLSLHSRLHFSPLIGYVYNEERGHVGGYV